MSSKIHDATFAAKGSFDVFVVATAVAKLVLEKVFYI